MFKYFSSSLDSRSIRTTVVLRITLFLIVLLALIALFSSYYIKRTTRTLLFEQQGTLIAAMTHEMDWVINSCRNSLVQFSSKLPAEVITNPSFARELLTKLSLPNKLFSHGLFLLDMEGALVAYSGESPHLSGPESLTTLLKEISSKKNTHIFPPVLCPATHHPVVVMMTLLRDHNGQIIGAVGGGMDLLKKGGVFENIIKMKIGKTGYPYLFGFDRTMILHPVASRIMQKDVPVGKNVMFDKAIGGFEGTGETVNSRGLHTFVSFKKLKNVDWILAINYPISDAFSAVKTFWYYFLLGLVAILLVSIVLAVKMATKITDPLLELTAQVQRISKDPGHDTLAEDLAFFQKEKSEIGILATSFAGLLQQLQKRMSDFEFNLQVVFNNTDKGIIIHSQEGEILAVNRPAQKLFGSTESEMCSLTVFELSAESSSKHKELPLLMQRIMAGEVLTFPWRCKAVKDQRQFDAEIYYTRIMWNNEPTLMGMVEDITVKKEKDALIHRLSTALDQSVNVVIMTNRQGVIEYANPSTEKMTGYSPGEVIGRTPQLFKSKIHPPEFYLNLWETIQAGKPWRGEICNRHKDGHLIWEDTVILPIIENDEITHFVAIKEDISLRKMHEDKLYRQANYDELTALPNRNRFNVHLHSLIAECRESSGKALLILMDLDDFKNVNNALGHSVGDMLLQAVAERLAKVLHPDTMIARLGGDEFAIVSSSTVGDTYIEKLAKTVMNSLVEPFYVHGQDIFVTATVGGAVFPDDGATLEDLFSNADAALYQAKRKGHCSFMRYSVELSEELLEKTRLTGMLRRALEREELLVYYQPQLELKTGNIVSFEALLRWQPQQETMISPDRFVSILEETGMIVPVGEWVLKQVCLQVKEWHEKGIFVQHTSVNLSLRQFNRPHIVQEVLSIVKECDVDPSVICLELTESFMMENFTDNLRKLHALRAEGFSISIDDFGTGYSSLNYLRRMHIQELKIDKSFIQSLADDTTLVKTILGMAHDLGLRVVAEGVETEEQKDFLLRQECECIQGYLLAPPMSTEQFESFFLASMES